MKTNGRCPRDLSVRAIRLWDDLHRDANVTWSPDATNTRRARRAVSTSRTNSRRRREAVASTGVWQTTA